MFNNNGGYSLSDIAAATNGGNDGLGSGDGSWIVLLLIVLLLGGNWNNGGYGNGGGGGTPYIASDIQRGFDQASLSAGINNLTTNVCNGFAGVNSNISNGFAQAEIANNARQMADMQQNFSLQSALQNCCCENRAATADLKYTIATEACADRTAVSNALRDVIASNTANTQAVLDKLCQQEIDAKNDLISTLRSQLSMADLRASQTAQTAQILAGQTAEVDALYNRLSNCPVPSTPVYGRVPIFTCNGNGCGCGNSNF